MPKVSVLVAVYNDGKHLAQSLGSLLRQTLSDIEIVCIDDNSTDDSLSILNDYARRDSRVVVIHQDVNTGQARARNNGLLRATGEYIAFLDSDDWMSDDCLEQAARVLDDHPDTGCVLLHVKNYMEGKNICEDYPMEPFEVMTGREAFELSLDWSIHGWYVARRKLYEDDHYDETCRSYSDDNTTHLHYYKSCEVRCCEGMFYYRINTVSVTHQASVRRFDWMRANESMKNHLEKLGVEERIMRRWETIRMLTLVDCYMFYHVRGRELSPTNRRYALSELRRVWGNIDRSMLDPSKVNKFGYRPMPCWWLFRLQEWVYFTIRGLMGKNRYY